MKRPAREVAVAVAHHLDLVLEEAAGQGVHLEPLAHQRARLPEGPGVVVRVEVGAVEEGVAFARDERLDEAADSLRVGLEADVDGDATLFRLGEHVAPVEDGAGVAEELGDRLDEDDMTRRCVGDQLRDVLAEANAEDDQVADIHDREAAECRGQATLADVAREPVEQRHRHR